MSVVAGKRNVADTPANKMFYAVDSARGLAVHTIRICSNPKVFDPRYNGVVDKIVGLAMGIYADAWEANHVLVRKDPEGKPLQSDWEIRRNYEVSAARKCSILLSMIDLSKQLFHLRSRKVKAWAQMTISTRADIIRWAQSDQKRYSSAQ